MRIELCPSGVDWIDGNLGGVPTMQPAVLLGDARSGKTAFAVSFTIAALRRGPACFVTTDVPEAVLELAATFLEHDLSPYLKNRQLTLLRFSNFFEQKVRSMRSIERPFTELGRLVKDRKIQSLVFDGFDPVLSWMEAANAKPLARNVVASLGQLGVTSLCTLRGSGEDIEVGPESFASLVSGAFELGQSRRDGMRSLRVRFASWCNVEGLDVPVELVQGQGIVSQEHEPSVNMRRREPAARNTGRGQAQDAPSVAVVTTIGKIVAARAAPASDFVPPPASFPPPPVDLGFAPPPSVPPPSMRPNQSTGRHSSRAVSPPARSAPPPQVKPARAVPHRPVFESDAESAEHTQLDFKAPTADEESLRTPIASRDDPFWAVPPAAAPYRPAPAPKSSAPPRSVRPPAQPGASGASARPPAASVRPSAPPGRGGGKAPIAPRSPSGRPPSAPLPPKKPGA